MLTVFRGAGFSPVQSSWISRLNTGSVSGVLPAHTLAAFLTLPVFAPGGGTCPQPTRESPR